MREDLGWDEHAIEVAILTRVAARGADKTICPSEVARHLGGPRPEDWRLLMAPIKRVAVRLVGQNRIAILRKGVPVADPATLKGIYRIGLPRGGR